MLKMLFKVPMYGYWWKQRGQGYCHNRDESSICRKLLLGGLWAPFIQTVFMVHTAGSWPLLGLLSKGPGSSWNSIFTISQFLMQRTRWTCTLQVGLPAPQSSQTEGVTGGFPRWLGSSASERIRSMPEEVLSGAARLGSEEGRLQVTTHFQLRKSLEGQDALLEKFTMLGNSL